MDIQVKSKNTKFGKKKKGFLSSAILRNFAAPHFSTLRDQVLRLLHGAGGLEAKFEFLIFNLFHNISGKHKFRCHIIVRRRPFRPCPRCVGPPPGHLVLAGGIHPIPARVERTPTVGRGGPPAGDFKITATLELPYIFSTLF